MLRPQPREGLVERDAWRAALILLYAGPDCLKISVIAVAK
jgi:hypothetical protein